MKVAYSIIGLLLLAAPAFPQSQQACPDDSKPIGPCINEGLCLAGYQCFNDNCCKIPDPPGPPEDPGPPEIVEPPEEKRPDPPPPEQAISTNKENAQGTQSELLSRQSRTVAPPVMQTGNGGTVTGSGDNSNVMQGYLITFSSPSANSGQCQSSQQCYRGTICISNQCICPSTMQTAAPGTCVTIAMPGQTCNNMQQCTGGSYCYSGLCYCPPGNVVQNNACSTPMATQNNQPMVNPGSYCSGFAQCSGGSSCVQSYCTCPPANIVQNNLCVSISLVTQPYQPPPVTMATPATYQPPTIAPPPITYAPPTEPPTYAPPTQAPTPPPTYAPPTQPPTYAPPTQPPTVPGPPATQPPPYQPATPAPAPYQPATYAPPPATYAPPPATYAPPPATYGPPATYAPPAPTGPPATYAPPPATYAPPPATYAPPPATYAPPPATYAPPPATYAPPPATYAPPPATYAPPPATYAPPPATYAPPPATYAPPPATYAPPPATYAPPPATYAPPPATYAPPPATYAPPPATYAPPPATYAPPPATYAPPPATYAPPPATYAPPPATYAPPPATYAPPPATYGPPATQPPDTYAPPPATYAPPPATYAPPPATYAPPPATYAPPPATFGPPATQPPETYAPTIMSSYGPPATVPPMTTPSPVVTPPPNPGSKCQGTMPCAGGSFCYMSICICPANAMVQNGMCVTVQMNNQQNNQYISQPYGPPVCFPNPGGYNANCPTQAYPLNGLCCCTIGLTLQNSQCVSGTGGSASPGQMPTDGDRTIVTPVPLPTSLLPFLASTLPPNLVAGPIPQSDMSYDDQLSQARIIGDAGFGGGGWNNIVGAEVRTIPPTETVQLPNPWQEIDDTLEIPNENQMISKEEIESANVITADDGDFYTIYKKAGGFCTMTEDCVGPHAYCLKNQCVCQRRYLQIGNYCVRRARKRKSSESSAADHVLRISHTDLLRLIMLAEQKKGVSKNSLHPGGVRKHRRRRISKVPSKA